jgi:hypothetical protein
MRILGLLNSNAAGGDASIPREELFPARMQRALTRSLDEEVEVVARSVWPTPRLPKLVDGWVRDFEPELVVFPVTGFWFLYESTPILLERQLGLPGRILGRASREVAARPWLAHNRAFQWSRGRTQRAIGGQSWFTAEEVIAVSKQVISAVLRREATYLVVVGPSGGEKWARDNGHRETLIARRRHVDAAVGEYCRSHHVEYWDEARRSAMTDPEPASLQGDNLHLDRNGHQRLAEYQFGLALGWAKRALQHSRSGEMVRPT